jgi:hypothetical protein
MRSFQTLILLSLLSMQSISVFAQKQLKDSSSTKTNQSKTKHVVDSTISEQNKKIKEETKSEAKSLKASVKQDLRDLKPDSTSKEAFKQNTKQTSGALLEKKASNLQYDSDNPDAAPWKNQQLSKDDLKDFDLPSKDGKLPSTEGKAEEYQDKIKNINSSSLDEGKLKNTAGTGKSEKIQKAKHVADSLIEIEDRIQNSSPEEELLNARQVYSKKYIQKMYDSLGITKADSLLQLGSSLAKTKTPKEELLSRINSPLKDKSGVPGVGYDEKNQALKSDDADKLQGMPDQFAKSDLSKMQLPPELLSELAPLKGQLMDSKYVSSIDSMRQVALKARGYVMDDKQLTEELKKSSLNKKPSFLDKTYFEMVLGFMQDSSFTVVQVAPAWAHHFKNRFSVGGGPNMSVKYIEKKFEGALGFRTFVKADVWKQRAYLQVEDNVAPVKVNIEAVRTTAHSFLVGGGALLPISKKFAINLAVFYRVNQEQVRPGGSPWVVRVGLSSMKKVGKN